MDDYQGRSEKEAVKHCPNCGSLMEFEPETGSLKCPACSNKIKLDLETGAGIAEENALNEGAIKKAAVEWKQGKVSVRCSSCGAQTVFDAMVKATVCPFCGSSQVIDVPLEDDVVAPTHVVPFTIGKKNAVAKFKEWIKGKWFTPNACKESAKPENMKGVYIPFWTFDSKTTSDYSARWGEDTTEMVPVVNTVDGKTTTTMEPRVKTTWHPVSGHYKSFFDDVLINANSDSDSDESIYRELEPFDFKKLLPYDARYLAGFLAERYTINLKQGWEKADARIREMLNNQITSEITQKFNADHVDSLKFTVVHSNTTFKHILLPLWISSYTFKGKAYHFLVNGQTGKVAGKAPISPLKVALFVLACIAVVYLLVKLIGG